MAARPYWKGQLRLALVSIPVELYSAQKSGPTIAFHQIHEPSGKRIRYEKVVPGIGPVSADDIARGFETGKGEYVLLDDKEIEAVRLESRRTLELTRFVETDSIDRIYYDRPYFLVPADELAQEAYVVVRDAMRASRKVGIGQLALRGREHVVAVRPCGRGMILETLRYAEEVNRAASYFRDIADARPDAELLELATSLIDRKTGAFDASEYRDHYVDAIRQLIEAKRRGKTVKAEPDERPSGGNVVDLMAALKRSVEGASRAPATPKPAKPPARPRRKTAA
jgi:DNA end-binding protein Ku